MIISKIKLHNWKNFQECSVEIAKRTFIVGANAAGKSNFLDAFDFLRDVAKKSGGLQAAVESRGGIKAIRCLSARRRTDVGIEVTLKESADEPDKWVYSLYFKHTGGGIRPNEVVVSSEKVLQVQEGRYLVCRTDNSPGETGDTLKYTHLEQAVTSQAFLEVRNVFAEMEYLNIIPQLVRESNSNSVNDDRFGRGFLMKLSKLNENTREKYLTEVNEVLRCVVPQLDGLSFVKGEGGLYHLEARYIHWRAKGSMQTERQFSDGTLRLIGFLFAFLAGKGVILLEEPELSLHAGVVAQLPEFIAKMQRNKNRQVIITTHSYDILSNSGIDENEVVLLQNGSEGTVAKVAADIDEVMQILDSGFSMADAVLPMTAPADAMQMSHVSID